MRAKRKRVSTAILMVGPIPVNGSYIGGIGMLVRHVIDYWNLAVPLAHFNPELRARDCGTTGKLSVGNLVAAVVNFVRLTLLAIKVRPQVVHYHTSRRLALLKDMIMAGWLRHFLHIPVVLQIHNSVADSILVTGIPCLQRAQLKGLLGCCDRVVFLSANVLGDLVALLREDADRLRSQSSVMHNFTILRNVCRMHEESTECVSLFYIGNIGREKGVYDILDAASRLRSETAYPFRVVLAGPFADKHEQQLVLGKVVDHQLSPIVTFLGSVYNEEKEAAFLQADIFVLPSYSEGIPLSMLEAMAYGLPVVVSGVGGIPEVVQDGEEGLMINPGDIEGLCRALKKLIESVECRQRMGAAARRRISAHHTVEIYMRQLQDLYNLVLAPRGRLDTSPSRPGAD